MALQHWIQHAGIYAGGKLDCVAERQTMRAVKDSHGGHGELKLGGLVPGAEWVAEVAVPVVLVPREAVEGLHSVRQPALIQAALGKHTQTVC